MKSPLRRCLRLHPALPLLLLASAVALVATPPLQNTESSAGTPSFSLLPRSFQKNPELDLTVLTEMTDAGKKLPPPSRDHPVYYVLQAAGYRAEGNAPSDRRQPAPEDLNLAFAHALAINGYQPASPAHPPALLIVYHWGTHSNLDDGSSEVPGSATPDIGNRNLLSRAALVGGAKFAEELRVALEKQAIENEVHSNRTVNEQRLGLAPEIGSIFIDFGPLRLFTDRDTKTRQLYTAALGDCYYAIASAYDYAEAAQGRRKLLWRSKMTSDAQGVALRDTLPGLILNGGKYFGVDMPEAATMAKRLKQETSVKLGPLEIRDYYDKLPASTSSTEGGGASTTPGEKKP